MNIFFFRHENSVYKAVASAHRMLNICIFHIIIPLFTDFVKNNCAQIFDKTKKRCMERLS